MWNPYAPLSPTARRMLAVAAVMFVIAIWAALSGSGVVGPAFLPTPWAVAKAFVRLCWDAERGQSMLLEATVASSWRVVKAAVAVTIVGLPLGILMGASPRINAILSPLFDPFRSAPVVALNPILVMWFGIGETMKVVFLFIGAVVYLVPMVRDAIVAVPRTYWISARDVGATEWEAVWLTLVPLALPRIADAFISAVSIMWTYITVAEYVNAESGLGQLIQNARRFSAMDQVFVGIFVIILLALVTYRLMLWVKGRLFPWEGTE